jgi:hypothetical protein
VKITQTHLEQLRALLRVGLTRVPSQQAYESRDPAIPRIALSTDPAKRHRWDALYRTDSTDWFKDVYKYANDDHIDTALRAIVKELSK